jgi:hypothetical protein
MPAGWGCWIGGAVRGLGALPDIRKNNGTALPIHIPSCRHPHGDIYNCTLFGLHVNRISSLIASPTFVNVRFPIGRILI